MITLNRGILVLMLLVSMVGATFAGAALSALLVGGPGEGPGVTVPGAVTVILDGSGFSPRNITMRPGGTVLFQSEADRPYHVALVPIAGDLPGRLPDTLALPRLVVAPGETAAVILPAEGRYLAVCTLPGHRARAGDLNILVSSQPAH